MTSGIIDVWSQLLDEQPSAPGWCARRINVEAPTAIYAALLIPEARKALLLEVKARSIHPSTTFPASSGFKVELETMVPGPNGTLRICLHLVDAGYEGVFGVLVEDVASSVARALTESAGISALIGRLNTWQRFLKRPGDGALSQEERTGLFAELLVLQELIRRGMPTSDAVTAWHGPWGGAQDFRLPTSAIEVKATLAVHPTSFEVSNLAQLDERPLPHLILRHIALICSADIGETLADIVEDIQKMLAPSDLNAYQHFSDSLLEVGYLPAHRSLYDQDRYRVASDRKFRVADAFPRILTDDVRPGVLTCSYVVELSACLPYQMDDPAAEAIIHGEIYE